MPDRVRAASEPELELDDPELVPGTGPRERALSLSPRGNESEDEDADQDEESEDEEQPAEAEERSEDEEADEGQDEQDEADDDNDEEQAMAGETSLAPEQPQPQRKPQPARKRAATAPPVATAKAAASPANTWTLEDLAAAVSRTEVAAGRSAITSEEFISWSEAHFSELLLEQRPKLPLRVRVRLCKAHRDLAVVGVPKKAPAPGYANLTEDAVAAIEKEFQRIAGSERTLDEGKIITLFENLGIVDSSEIDAAREEQQGLNTSSPGSATRRASAREHLTWFFRDIDVSRSRRVDW